MTSGGEIYLAIVLAAFLTYIGTLFWAMVTGSSSRSNASDKAPPRRH